MNLSEIRPIRKMAPRGDKEIPVSALVQGLAAEMAEKALSEIDALALDHKRLAPHLVVDRQNVFSQNADKE